jgi:hypothetical protein
MSEASFAFKVVDQRWDASYENREILAVDLHRGDVSICSRGANANTNVTARALARRLAGTSGRGMPLSLAMTRLRALRLQGWRR